MLLNLQCRQMHVALGFAAFNSRVVLAIRTHHDKGSKLDRHFECLDCSLKLLANATCELDTKPPRVKANAADLFDCPVLFRGGSLHHHHKRAVRVGLRVDQRSKLLVHRSLGSLLRRRAKRPSRHSNVPGPGYALEQNHHTTRNPRPGWHFLRAISLVRSRDPQSTTIISSATLRMLSSDAATISAQSRTIIATLKRRCETADCEPGMRRSLASV